MLDNLPDRVNLMVGSLKIPKNKGEISRMLSNKVRELATNYDGTIGKLPAHAFPGGYPIFYVNDHNDVLCPDCANDTEEYDETIVNYDVNWEDASLYCDHCSQRIESAYAEEENN